MAFTTASVGLATAAAAAVPGFDVKITELPQTFSAGAGPRTITVVASTDVGRQCQKVRWSMLMRVTGVDLDQVRVQRIEDNGAFPLRVQTEGDVARLTDEQLDPGSLCRGQTVTARYQVSVDGGADPGRVTFQAEAYDVNARLLQLATATSSVVKGGAAEPDDRATRPPAPSPSVTDGDSSDGAGAGENADADAPAGDDADADDPAPSPSPDLAAAAAANDGGGSLLGIGLIVGAVLIFLGVGLLLRLRLRVREADGGPMTTSFNPLP